MPTLRCSVSQTAWGKLHALREYFGHRWSSQTFEQIVHEAHGYYLAPTDWNQDVNRAIKVMGRVKPTLIIGPGEVLAVRKTPTKVDIWVRLEAEPFTVSKQEWDK